jgi:hypothetical protein
MGRPEGRAVKVKITHRGTITLHGLDRLAEQCDRERAAGRHPPAERLMERR